MIPRERAAIGVAQLTRLIGSALADFGPLVVEGELTQRRIAPSGHCYATLKERDAVIGVVMWRSSVVRHGDIPADGTRVQVAGHLDVYAPRGGYQLIARTITPIGAGDLLARLAALKARLAEEGLFADERKRPLPRLPRAVGIASAAGSAALADLLATIRARFPAMPIVHAPCRVQGDGAAASIAAAITRLGGHGEVDVVVCGRGGGSQEDLQAFNDEALVRALAACPVPVVSAVGHETDWTLCDLVADVRAKTPTAAGELVVPVAADLRAVLDAARARLDATIAAAMAQARRVVAALATHRALAAPGHLLAQARQRVDEARERLDQAAIAARTLPERRLAVIQARLAAAHPTRTLIARRALVQVLAERLDRAAVRCTERAGERWTAAAQRLALLSPLAVIERGYAVLRTGDGTVVRRRSQAPPGTPVAARVVDGWLDLRAEGGRPQRLDEPGEAYRE